MRVFLILVAIIFFNGCAGGDTVAKRKEGQQLVCHKGHTKAVNAGDYFIHIDHGDSIGPCPEEK